MPNSTVLGTGRFILLDVLSDRRDKAGLEMLALDCSEY